MIGIQGSRDLCGRKKEEEVDREAEIAILQSLLHYAETKTTALTDSAWQNPVSAYTCPDRHHQEEALLIRARPLVWGLSCDWPKPGSYRTDDYSGVPVLTVRGRDGKLHAFINTCRHRGAKVASGEGVRLRTQSDHQITMAAKATEEAKLRASLS
jgi:hypothetical protein